MRMLLFLFSIIIQSPASFFSQRLNTIDHFTYDFQNLRKNKATVVVILLSDCPACQSYSLTLNNLNKKFGKEGVGFIGVFPGTYSSDEKLKAFRKDFNIGFSLLADPTMKFSKSLGATIAPEAFVIDANGNTVYQGRIDDWMYALGKKRISVRSRDLENALNAVLSGHEVKNRKTNAIGCILNYE